MKPYYSQDGIEIFNGDNRTVMEGLPDASIDLVVTSPPYDNLREYGGHSWDFPSVASHLTRLLNPGGVIVWIVADATIDGSETGTSMRQALHFKDSCGLNLHDTMIYKKTNGGANGSMKAYLACWEYCFILSRGIPKSINLIRDRKNITPPRCIEEAAGRRKVSGEVKGRRIINRTEFGVRWNIWEYAVGGSCISSDDIKLDHPAMFPESLARDHILSWSNPGDTVLDPFCGSGTTLKMSKQEARKGIGIEINERYCEIAANRLRQGVLFGATP